MCFVSIVWVNVDVCVWCVGDYVFVIVCVDVVLGKRCRHVDRCWVG